MFLAWALYSVLKLPQDDKAADHDFRMKKPISVRMAGAETQLKL